MINQFVPMFLENLPYISNITLPLSTYLPFAVYLFGFFWAFTLLLQDSTSTRVNHQLALFRSSVNSNMVRLYQL